MCPVGLHGLGWNAARESSPNAKVSFEPLKLGAFRLARVRHPGAVERTERYGADVAGAVGIDFGDRREFALRRDLLPFGEDPAVSGITSRECVP